MLRHDIFAWTKARPLSQWREPIPTLLSILIFIKLKDAWTTWTPGFWCSLFLGVLGKDSCPTPEDNVFYKKLQSPCKEEKKISNPMETFIQYSPSTRMRWVDLIKLAHSPGNPECKHIIISQKNFPIVSLNINFYIMGTGLSTWWIEGEWPYLSFLHPNVPFHDWLCCPIYCDLSFSLGVSQNFCAVLVLDNKLCGNRRVEFCHHQWLLKTREGEQRTTQCKTSVSLDPLRYNLPFSH